MPPQKNTRQTQTIKRLYRLGNTYEVIAKSVGISKKGVEMRLYKLIRSGEVSKRGICKEQHSKDVLSKIVVLFQAGETYGTIAAAVGISAGAVAQRLSVLFRAGKLQRRRNLPPYKKRSPKTP